MAREIEVIVRVRVRLCRNACVSRRMRESWQLCIVLTSGGSTQVVPTCIGCMDDIQEIDITTLFEI